MHERWHTIGTMTLIEKSLTIALQAHAGQVDKAGRPYILHPLRIWQKWIPITPDDVKNDLYTIKEIGISILKAYKE